MIDRFLLIITIVISLFCIVKYLKYRQFRKVKSISNKLADNKQTTPYIVYFWSPHCPQCKTMQQAILKRISQKFSYSIRKINITEHNNMVKKWNVRTVPTTYILNSSGEIKFINNGLKSEKEIIAQLRNL